MPTLDRTLTLAAGDAVEILETAAMTGGERVRCKLLFSPGGLRVDPHVHVHQDETYEVISGTLTYTLDGVRHQAGPGATVLLPRGVPHQHYSEGPEPTVAVQTITPGLDFDYLIESIFGLGSEGRAVQGLDNVVQGLVWIRKMRSTLLLGAPPRWLQYALARVVTPFAYLAGYRAVHRRFSGEDW